MVVAFEEPVHARDRTRGPEICESDGTGLTVGSFSRIKTSVFERSARANALKKTFVHLSGGSQFVAVTGAIAPNNL